MNQCNTLYILNIRNIICNYISVKNRHMGFGVRQVWVQVSWFLDLDLLIYKTRLVILSLLEYCKDLHNCQIAKNFKKGFIIFPKLMEIQASMMNMSYWS